MQLKLPLPEGEMADLVRLTGLSFSHVSRLFGGSRTPSVRVLYRLCVALRSMGYDVSVDQLMHLLVVDRDYTSAVLTR